MMNPSEECPCVRTFVEEKEIIAALMVLVRNLPRVVVAEMAFGADGNIESATLTLAPKQDRSTGN